MCLFVASPRLNDDHTTSRGMKYVFVIALSIAMTEITHAQTQELHGQVSGWTSANPESPAASQFGLRYIPDLLVERKLGDGLAGSVDLSLNANATAQYETDQRTSYGSALNLYRTWFRLATDRFETRIGLQKINFGSALLFRPLMWFDRVDPRDPLQLTDGVYGILARYYFQDNTNIWVWGLYGNNGTKGLELEPTEQRTVEYGGRVQSPLWSGEVGLTVHHRRANQSELLPAVSDTIARSIPEDRIGLDGKWDIGIGIWFETVLIRQQTELPGMKYQRQWTVGADYTFSIGNGLYVAAEYFGAESPDEPLSSATGQEFSGLSVSYPVGILDQVSAIVYRDWRNRQWYRIATWQRSYDNWSLYLLGFWDPRNIQIYHMEGGSNAFAGTGFQIMVVFNH